MDTLISLPLGKVRNSATYVVKLRRPNIFYPRKYLDIDTLNVAVLQRPRIESLNISVQSPEYSGISPASYQGNMDTISILKGSHVSFDIKLSEEIGPSLALWGRDTLPLKIEKRSARLTWIPKDGGEIRFLLKNKHGINTQSNPSYVIDIDKDQYPELRVLEPKIGDEHILNEQMVLPYVLQLQDDFGVSDLSVYYLSFSEYSFFNDTVYQRIGLPFASDSRLQTRIGVWEINDFISPGSEIRYYFELSDNDAVSGPKKFVHHYTTLSCPRLEIFLILKMNLRKKPWPCWKMSLYQPKRSLKTLKRYAWTC